MVKRAGLDPAVLADIRAKDRAIKAAIPLEDKRAYNAQWRDTVPEEWREAKRAYNRERYRQKREALLAQDRAYRAANAEKVLSRQRAHYYANREARIAQMIPVAERRRARVAGVSAHRFTASDWRRIVRRHEGRCFYCGTRPERLTKEHVIPISRGGQHSEGNIVPACFPCNRAKGYKTIVEWRAGRVGRLAA